MQGALDAKIRRHYEQPRTGTKTANGECKEFASRKTHVAKTLARIDVDEEQLAEAKAAAEGYAAQLAIAIAQLDASEKDSGDLANKLTKQLINNLHAEDARNDKKLNEAIAAGEEYVAQLAKANHEFKDKCDEVDNLQRKLED